MLSLTENLLDLIEQIKTTAIAIEIGFNLVIIVFAYYLLTDPQLKMTGFTTLFQMLVKVIHYAVL